MGNNEIKPADITLPVNHIQSMIFTIRGIQVMVDRDLATVYEVETKVLNQAVKRNIERFPQKFRFQLNDTEKEELVTNCDRFKALKHSIGNPYVFTDERRQIAFESETEKNFEKVFKALESGEPPKQGIFYDGQIYDAYTFVCDLIRKAGKSLVLIDNYEDDSVLTLLSKRKSGSLFIIYLQPSKGNFLSACLRAVTYRQAEAESTQVGRSWAMGSNTLLNKKPITFNSVKPYLTIDTYGETSL